MDKKEIVNQYTRAGFKLIELYGKVPLKKNWTEDTTDNGKLSLMYNLGAVLSDSDIVIDVDPRNFSKGDNPIERLKNKIGTLNTFMVRTGGGGIHIYLKKPKDHAIRENLAEYKGIEFKGTGRQVVIPPSKHPDTNKMYEIIHGSVDKIMTAPPALLELIKQTKDYKKADASQFEFDDSDSNTSRYMSFLKTAAPKAIEGNMGDKTTYQVASFGKDFGLSPEKTFEFMWAHWNSKCQPPWLYEDLWEKVCNAFRYTKTEQQHFASKFLDSVDTETENQTYVWDVNADQSLKPSLTNVINFLNGYDKQLRNLFRFNLFSRRIEFKRKPFWRLEREHSVEIKDSDVIEIQFYLADTNKRFYVKTQIIYDAILLTSRKDMYHPVVDYIKTLTWDRTPRLETWLIDCAGASNIKYIREVSKKTLVAAVARVMNPGVKFDSITVLEGAQGKRKSTLCNVLGGEWFADMTIDLKSKDTVEAIQGKWIVEISEMEVTKKADAQSLKAFLSRRVDRLRVPYARASEDFPRQGIFIGTINPTGGGYLKDSTGNRRFWIVKTRGMIDTEKIAEMRDQLFAEAYHEYLKGCNLYLEDQEAIDQAREEAESRQIADPWLTSINMYLNRKGVDVSTTSITEIAQEALSIFPRDLNPVVTNRIGVCLKMLGFDKTIGSQGETIYNKEKGEQ